MATQSNTRAKHPFNHVFTLAKIASRKDALEFISGKLTFEALYDLGIWSGKKNSDGIGWQTKSSCDWLESATALVETERGIVAYIDCEDARHFKALRMNMIVLEEDGHGWVPPSTHITQLGRYAVIIIDLEAFLQRILHALGSRYGGDVRFLADVVVYFDPTIQQRPVSMFSKNKKYEWQHEFRFLFCDADDFGPVLGARLKTERVPKPATLDIGDIRDIARMLSVDNLLEGNLSTTIALRPAMKSYGLLSTFERVVNTTRLEMSKYMARGIPSVVIDPNTEEMSRYEDVFGDGSAYVEGWQFMRPGIRLSRGFAKKEWAEDFLDGNIYMNTLGYFWACGNEEQADLLEGACMDVQPDLVKGFTKEFVDAQVEYMTVVPAGKQYCNVCCFMMQAASPTDRGMHTMISSPLDTLDLGEYLVVIDDPFELTCRITREVESLGYACAMGPVEYRPRKKVPRDHDVRHTVTLKTHEPLSFDSVFPDGRPVLTSDAFVKTTKYRNQMEWRVVLYRGEKTTDAFVLSVGDLRDICHVIRRAELSSSNEDALFARASWLSCEFYGNATREELRDTFIRLGDDKVYLIATVG